METIFFPGSNASPLHEVLCFLWLINYYTKSITPIYINKLYYYLLKLSLVGVKPIDEGSKMKRNSHYSGWRKTEISQHEYLEITHHWQQHSSLNHQTTHYSINTIKLVTHLSIRFLHFTYKKCVPKSRYIWQT